MKPIIRYYPNGNKHYETYYVNRKRHRLDGPAFIQYNYNGNIDYKSYYINDKLHRLDGPAFIWYNESGNIEYEEYWINDIEIPKNDIDEILEQCGSDKQLLKDILTIRFL